MKIWMALVIFTTTGLAMAQTPESTYKADIDVSQLTPTTYSIEMDPVASVLGVPTLAAGLTLGTRLHLAAIFGFSTKDQIYRNTLKNNNQDITVTDYTLQSQSLGLETLVTLNGMVHESAFYLKAGVVQSYVKIKNRVLNHSGSMDRTMALAQAGYQWVFDTGLRLRLGAGVSGAIEEQYDLSSMTTDVVGESDLEKLPTFTQFEFRLGYIF